MTEGEAKTKWCPFVRGTGHMDTRCIASGCMAWRWVEEMKYEFGEPLPERSTPAGAEWEKHGRSYPTERGRKQQWRRPLPQHRNGACGLVRGD